MTERIVIEQASKSRHLFWKDPGEESAGDKQASAVTADWQNNLVASDGKRYRKEVPISSTAREKIDLIDMLDRTAYEFKVAASNPHHEFYKDVFKVLVYNRNHESEKLSKFIFITASTAAGKLNETFLARSVIQCGKELGFIISIVGV